MGSADVIPGVSGGTMAFILGIYTRLLNAIKSFDLVWLKAILRLDWKVVMGEPDFALLIPLFTGIIGALMFFTRVISLPHLLHTHPEPVYALFFGLIAGSIIVLIEHVKKMSVADYFCLLGGTVFGLIVFNLVPVETPETTWFVFISGALAISAMILPGISGSFILLILKKYDYIFSAVGHLDFAILVPFVLGIITGIMLFARFLSWLLARFYQETILVINGLLLASLWVIWPYQERTYVEVAGKSRLIGTSPFIPHTFTGNTLVIILIALAGLALVLVIDRYAKKISVNGD